MIKRCVGGVLLGSVVTFGLLLLMRAAMANSDAAVEIGVQGHVVELVQVREDQPVQPLELQPDPPLPPEEEPPPLPPPPVDAKYTVRTPIGPVNVPQRVKLSRGGFSEQDGEYLPIMKVNAAYPPRLLARGVEGYVLLEFVVTETGNVRDPVVIESQPPGAFDRAAIAAALKFKYKPKMVNGMPMAVAGVRNLIKFAIEDR